MRTKALMFASLLGLVAGDASAARIYVTTPTPGIGTGACSLQEAIYSSILHDTLDGVNGIAIDATDQGNPPDHFITTKCVIGDGNDTIVLPTKGSLQMTGALQPYGFVDGDAYNPYGPTATPLIFSTITIEGDGATLQWDANATGNVRLFAVGAGSIKTPNGTAQGTGSLTLRNVHVQGFRAKGGDGGTGAGGGLGAGGAIYLQYGSLVVENSTFEGNQAVGGNGAVEDGGFGGGGGLSGNGGRSPTLGAGGGGGGARGDGGKSTQTGGGGGGGTVFAGGVADVGGPGGYLCGGSGASDGDGGNGCGGGGGGGGAGGGTSGFFEGSGGNGGYGGGGGGAPNDGGSGGFGGGGGTGGDNGGGGGFGGGGGLGGIFGGAFSGNSGAGGAFGGNGGSDGGGGGGALGGAIFNDGGTVTVRNSTFTNNAVSRGVGAGGGGNGGDAGGAIFTHDGDLTIVNSTFSGNQSTGSGGAVVAYMESDSGIGGPDIFINFTLENTIIANNGANECFYTGNVHAQGTHNLIMSNGSGSQPFGSCADPVVTDDPQLQGLADNGGYTKTMAIPFGSVAMGAADSATSLTTDQRGAARPQAGGFDIGAYEVCRIKVGAVFQPAPCSETTQQDPPIILTMLASTGGATDPAAGDHPEVSNTVVPLKATADSGYYFTGWTGNVVQSTSASTTIIMNAPYTVGANFQLHDFTLSANPTTLSIPLGGVGSTAVTATALGNFGDKVTLSQTGAPAGVTTSFGTNPVAPVPGTPASSIFKLTVGPSARPQSFTETVNGNATGLAGALTRSVSVNVTIVATAPAIVNVIGQQQALGCIDQSGIVQSLASKMNTYQMLASGGHVQGASNVLTAFQYEVQAQIGHHIATSCTDSVTSDAFSPGNTLIADAQSLQATLATPVKGAPVVGSVVSTSDAGTAGRVVNLMRGKTIVATASTDAAGFYYLDTTALKAGSQYSVSVTIPKGYKASSPASQTFTWTGKALQLATFTLN